MCQKKKVFAECLHDLSIPVALNVMAGELGKSGPPGNRNGETHGYTVLKRAINGIGNRLIDRRTITGRALAKWRVDLIQDLGGDVSTQQTALIDLAVKSKLLLDSIDAWLLTQPTLINKKKKSLLPVVRERQQLADGLAKYLAMLGLQKRSREVTLTDYVQQHYGEHDTVKSKSSVPVSKAASDSPGSFLVKENDLDV